MSESPDVVIIWRVTHYRTEEGLWCAFLYHFLFRLAAGGLHSGVGKNGSVGSRATTMRRRYSEHFLEQGSDKDIKPHRTRIVMATIPPF